MAAGEARVRAWWGKTTLARVRAHPHGPLMLTAVGSELIDLFDQSTRLSWVPMIKHAQLCERLIRQVGERKFVMIMTAPDPDPAVAANMQARLGTYGRDPLVLLKHTATMWTDVTADAGTLVVTAEGEREALLSFEHLPSIAMGGWLKLSFEALIERALVATEAQGTITSEASSASRMIALRVTW